MGDELNTYKKALISGKLGFWSWDVISNKTSWGDEKFILFGYEPQEFEVTYERAFQSVHPDDVAVITSTMEREMPISDNFDYEYRGIQKSGNIINVWVKVEVLRNDLGEVIGVNGISQDVTDRKKLELDIIEMNSTLEKKVEERTKELQTKISENILLLKEMHHRVKNNLQVMSSILSLQKNYFNDDNLKKALDQSISRIKTMALIHESLYSKNNLERINVKIYFEQLFSYHLDDFPDVSVDLELPSIFLSIDKMMPLGMIINELISNSIKHAFEIESNPKIKFLISEYENELTLQYSDNGSGYEKGVKNSFGMDLINTLIEDLETTLIIQNQAKGLQVGFNILVPQ